MSDPDPQGDEHALLTQYLDTQRGIVVRKAAGLTREQLGRRHPPSTLTLAGLLLHLALVEESWLEVRFLGLPQREPWSGVDWDADRDWEFRTAVAWDPDELRRRYCLACDRSRAVTAEVRDLDRLSARPPRTGAKVSLRWVLLHLIEETARHAGHADLLREAVDGSVGE